MATNLSASSDRRLNTILRVWARGPDFSLLVTFYSYFSGFCFCHCFNCLRVGACWGLCKMDFSEWPLRNSPLISFMYVQYVFFSFQPCLSVSIILFLPTFVHHISPPINMFLFPNNCLHHWVIVCSFISVGWCSWLLPCKSANSIIQCLPITFTSFFSQSGMWPFFQVCVTLRWT